MQATQTRPAKAKTAKQPAAAPTTTPAELAPAAWRAQALTVREQIQQLLHDSVDCWGLKPTCNDAHRVLDVIDENIDAFFSEPTWAAATQEDFEVRLIDIHATLCAALLLASDTYPVQWVGLVRMALTVIENAVPSDAPLSFQKYQPSAGDKQALEERATLVDECHEMLTDATWEIEQLAEQMLGMVRDDNLSESLMRHMGRGMLLRIKKLTLDAIYDALVPDANNATPASIREAIYG